MEILDSGLFEDDIETCEQLLSLCGRASRARKRVATTPCRATGLRARRRFAAARSSAVGAPLGGGHRGSCPRADRGLSGGALVLRPPVAALARPAFCTPDPAVSILT